MYNKLEDKKTSGIKVGAKFKPKISKQPAENIFIPKIGNLSYGEFTLACCSCRSCEIRQKPKAGDGPVRFCIFHMLEVSKKFCHNYG